MADSVPTMASKRTVQLLLVLTIVISIWVSRLHGQLWALAPIGVLCSLAWCVCCTAVLAVCPVVARSPGRRGPNSGRSHVHSVHRCL